MTGKPDSTLTSVANKIEVIPLGGLGEFGMNMMAIGYAGRYILIDCGKMFPEERHLGIEAVIPDFTFVREHKDDILGLFLTHGHEDHIGAVAHLLREFDIPIWGTPLTLGLTRMRLKEFRLQETAELNETQRGETVTVGPFNVHFIGVSHGIPDSCALAVTTPAGTVIHTGDFKIDQTPLDGYTFDFHTFAEYGRKGVLLLLSDSTNVERRGYTYSEREVYDDFVRIFTEAQGKILVASFASHLHRMQQIIDLAEDFGRKVAFVGRSMEQNSRLARELGYLDIPDGIEISSKDVGDYPRDRVVVIASGSQAEPNSALSKIATDRHPNVKLKEGDTVALSARKIPGNEKAISNIINHLTMRGAQVHHDGTLDIHVSGHGCQEELKMMISLTQPRFFIPVHGEYHQLHSHAQLAGQMGVAEENILIAQSGEVVTVNEREIAITGDVQVGHVLVDRSDIEEMDQAAVHDRRILAQEGVVAPIIAISLQQGRRPKVVNFHLLTKALSSEEETREISEGVEDLVVKLVENSSAEECRDDELMKAKVGKAIRKLLLKALNIRPMILPVILEV